MNNLILLSVLFVFTACIDSSSLKDLENFGNNELETNVKEFSQLEIQKWWEIHFEQMGKLMTAKAQAFLQGRESIPRSMEIKQRDSVTLIKELIRIHEINISLKKISYDVTTGLDNWSTSCSTISLNQTLELKEKIIKNYTHALNLPQLEETYMVGGGSGEEGNAMMFDSIINNISTLINQNEVNRFKKKIKTIKRIFQEKLPTETYFMELSKSICLKSAEKSIKTAEVLSPLAKNLENISKEEWTYYLSKRRIFGQELLERNFFENNQLTQREMELLGFYKILKLDLNLSKMRNYASSLLNRFKAKNSTPAREDLLDFIYSFEVQLGLLEKINDHELHSVLHDNRVFLAGLKKEML